MSVDSDSSFDRQLKTEIKQNERIESNPQPISPIIIIKTKSFKSYRKPKERKRIRFVCDVWPKTDWFVDDCSRQTAESLLNSTKNGTFLIRKSRLFEETGCYAMSIAFNQSVYHCLVHKFSNGFGFDSKRIFRSLEELVSHYKNFESLVVHNSLLDCHLSVPLKND